MVLRHLVDKSSMLEFHLTYIAVLVAVEPLWWGAGQAASEDGHGRQTGP